MFERIQLRTHPLINHIFERIQLRKKKKHVERTLTALMVCFGTVVRIALKMYKCPLFMIYTMVFMLACALECRTCLKSVFHSLMLTFLSVRRSVVFSFTRIRLRIITVKVKCVYLLTLRNLVVCGIWHLFVMMNEIIEVLSYYSQK